MPPFDLHKMEVRLSVPVSMKRLVPMKVPAPTFWRHCMQCVDLPTQEQLLGRSNILFIPK